MDVRIGLASDTLGSVTLLERALAHFRRAQVDRVFFLGGCAADLDAVLARNPAVAQEPLARKFVRIASRACPEYASGDVPRKQVDLVAGRICCLVHDKGELTRDDIENASILFHGSSGDAALVQIGPRCFVTPGRLRAAAPGEGPATFAIADVTQEELVLTVFSETCAELRQERAAFAAGGKMSVR